MFEIIWSMIILIIIENVVCLQVSHESSLILNFLLEKGCAVHIANFMSSPDSGIQADNSTSILSSDLMRIGSMESYDLILESVNVNYIHHSFTDPKLWSDKHAYLDTFLPSLHYKISGCITFLIINPTVSQITDSIEHSGFFLEPSTLFLVYVSQNWFTKAQYPRVQIGHDAGINDDGNSISFAWFNPRILFSDVTIVFLIGGPSDLPTVEFGLFCYLCKDKLFMLEKVAVNQVWTELYKKYRELNNDLLGENVAVENAWWVDNGVRCDPFQHGKRWNEFTCFPHGRIILNFLIRKFNFSVIFPTSDEVSASLIYSPPYFGSKHTMVILPGPYSRSYPHNYSNSLFYNTSTDRLFYCANIHESSHGIMNLFATLTQPFQPTVWMSLVGSTGLMVLVVKPKDPIRFLSIIVGQGYLALLPGKGKRFRYCLLIFWSLIISTSISFLYDGLLTADMLVPVPDKVIGTFKELVLRGFKIGYMLDYDLSEARKWYEENFRRNDIMDKLNDAFVNVKFDNTIYELVVNMSGKLSIFREEIEIEIALPKIREQVWKFKKPVKCNMAGEPLYPLTGMVTYSSIFIFHMSRAFQKAMTHMVEAGLLNELTKISIWQNSKLPKMPWERELNNKNFFKPAGLTGDSKIPVIFLLFVFGLSFAVFTILGELIVRKLTEGEKRHSDPVKSIPQRIVNNHSASVQVCDMISLSRR